MKIYAIMIVKNESDVLRSVLDADEFYEEDPREFLSGIPKRYQVVAKKSLDFLKRTDIRCFIPKTFLLMSRYIYFPEC